MVETGLQQSARRAGVVAVVLERQRHRLRHDRVGCEVHDRIDLVLGQQARHQGLIADVADDQRAGRHRLAKALDEVIEDDDPFTRARPAGGRRGCRCNRRRR